MAGLCICTDLPWLCPMQDNHQNRNIYLFHALDNECINYPKTAAFVTLPRDRLRSYFRWMYPSNNFTGFVAFLAQCQSDISIIVKLIKGLAARIARSNLVLVKAISACSAYSHVVFPAAAEICSIQRPHVSVHGMFPVVAASVAHYPLATVSSGFCVRYSARRTGADGGYFRLNPRGLFRRIRRVRTSICFPQSMSVSVLLLIGFLASYLRGITALVCAVFPSPVSGEFCFAFGTDHFFASRTMIGQLVPSNP